MRRMRFSIAWDVLLLKSVTAVDAHLAAHGQSQKRFEAAVPIFLSSLPSPALEETGIPSWKTLTDRFKKIVAGHRAAVKANVVASGIIEVRGEREILLDDIVLAIDEWEESRRAERDERTELDKRLQVAGEAIRTRALSRERSTATPREGKDKPKHTERKRAMSYDSDDEARCTLSEHMSEQRDVDHKRLKMEERKLEYEISRDERARERLKVAQDHEARRIAVEEKRMELEEHRLEIEREERRGAIQERTQMMVVLSALAKKLE